MTHETIERDGKPFVLVPKAAYERMRAALEDRDDVRADDAAKAAQPEMVPATIADRLLAGENAIRVWREHRELSRESANGWCSPQDRIYAVEDSGVRPMSFAEWLPEGLPPVLGGTACDVKG
jgi:hypothetical protein